LITSIRRAHDIISRRQQSLVETAAIVCFKPNYDSCLLIDYFNGCAFERRARLAVSDIAFEGAGQSVLSLSQRAGEERERGQQN